MASAIAALETLPGHSRTISFQVRPRSSCSKTIQTIIRVPLNVGCPPQISESAAMCRPNSTRRLVASRLMSVHCTMRPERTRGKPK